MHFLPDVEVRCQQCHGRRYKRETLAIRYRGNDIAEVLDMTVEEALILFPHVPKMRRRLKMLSTSAWATCASASPPRPSRAARPSA